MPRGRPAKTIEGVNILPETEEQKRKANEAWKKCRPDEFRAVHYFKDDAEIVKILRITRYSHSALEGRDPGKVGQTLFAQFKKVRGRWIGVGRSKNLEVARLKSLTGIELK